MERGKGNGLGEGGDAGEVQGGPRGCVEPDRGQTGVLEFGALAMELSVTVGGTAVVEVGWEVSGDLRNHMQTCLPRGC